MGYRGLFWLISSLLLALLVDVCFSWDFQPIDPPDSDYGHQLYSRDASEKIEDPTAPEEYKSLFSSAENGKYAAMLNFTILPQKNTAILSMEKFRSLLDDDLNCTPEGMTFSFKDKKSYKRGKKAWEWVNESDDRKFLLITSIQDCDSTQKGNKHRVFWLVKNVLFNRQGKDVNITAEKSEWQDIVHAFVWDVRKQPPSLRKRGLKDKFDEAKDKAKNKLKDKLDITKDGSFSIDFEHSFGEKDQNKSFGDTGVTWACGEECHSTGELESAYTFMLDPDQKSSFRFSISPKNVSLILNPKLGLYGVKLKTVKSDEFEVFRKSLVPIPGIDALNRWIRIGPFYVVRVGYSIGPLEADGEFTKPYSLNIKDGAKAEMMVENNFEDGNATSSGWDAEGSDKDLDVNGTMKGGFFTSISSGFELRGEFGKQNSDSRVIGISTGFYVRQLIGTNFTADSSEDGRSCANSDKSFETIMNMDPYAGSDMKWEFEANGKRLFNHKLLETTTTLPATCTGFGSVSATKSSHSKPTSDSTKSGKSSKATKSSSKGATWHADKPCDQDDLYPTPGQGSNKPFRLHKPVQTGTRGSNNNPYYNSRLGQYKQHNDPDQPKHQQNQQQNQQQKGVLSGQQQNGDQRPAQNLNNGQLEEECDQNDFSGQGENTNNNNNQISEGYSDQSLSNYRRSQHDTGPGPQDSVQVLPNQT